MMSVFGLLALNSNDHDVITIIKQGCLSLSLGLFAIGPEFLAVSFKLTITLPNFQLTVRLLYKVVWP